MKYSYPLYQIANGVLVLVALLLPAYCFMLWRKRLALSPETVSRKRLFLLGAIGGLIWVGSAYYVFVALQVAFGFMIYAAGEPGASDQGMGAVIMILVFFLLIILLWGLIGRLMYLLINRVVAK
jgi:hypothetical protein